MIRSEQEKRDNKIKEAFLRGERTRSIASYFGLSTQQTNTILNRLFPERKKRLDK